MSTQRRRYLVLHRFYSRSVQFPGTGVKAGTARQKLQPAVDGLTVSH